MLFDGLRCCAEGVMGGAALPVVSGAAEVVAVFFVGGLVLVAGAVSGVSLAHPVRKTTARRQKNREQDFITIAWLLCTAEVDWASIRDFLCKFLRDCP